MNRKIISASSSQIGRNEMRLNGYCTRELDLRIGFSLRAELSVATATGIDGYSLRSQRHAANVDYCCASLNKCCASSFAARFIFILLASIFLFGFVNAATTTFSGTASGAASSTYQYRANFQTYYSSSAGNGLGTMQDTYWPQLGDKSTCEQRQDLLLFVPPAGCQPTVVRSDLLEEQNVPVFCKIDSIQVNPLLDIKQIQNIVFDGKMPENVVGAGFHPARAALQTRDKLLGSPLVNDIGYVVLVLKKQPVEANMPDFVNVTLQAQIQYLSGNAYGIGKAEFILEPVSDTTWESQRFKQSFWNGRYFVRLDRVDANSADVSLYDGIKKITTIHAEQGKQTQTIYMPGLYCQAGLQVTYDGLVDSTDAKATIEVSSDSGVDVFDVYPGSKFMDDRCTVATVVADSNGETGKVTGACGANKFELSFLSSTAQGFEVLKINGVLKEPMIQDAIVTVDLTTLQGTGAATYILDEKNSLTKLPRGVNGGKGEIVVDANGNVVGKVGGNDKAWTVAVWNALKIYRDEKAKNGNFAFSSANNRKLNDAAKKYYDAAIADYKTISENYPYETNRHSGIDETYSEEALRNAISLARVAGADTQRGELLNMYLRLYSNASSSSGFERELNDLYKIDASRASQTVQFDDRTRVLRLMSIALPSSTARTTFVVERKTVELLRTETTTLSDSGRKFGTMIIDSVRPDGARVSAYCMERSNGNSNGQSRNSVSPSIFSGKTPHYSDGQRLQIDFDGDVGSYSIDSNNILQFYFVDKNIWAEGAGWDNSDADAKSWRDTLRTALINYKNNNKVNDAIVSDGGYVLSHNRQSFDFVLDKTQVVCGLNVKLVSTDVGQTAKIRLTPWARGTKSVTNVTVGVGIEKRNIKLTPDAAMQKVENLNKTIAQWEKISKQLGTAVSGLKAACFATSGLLTFKNFMSGLSGEAIARQQVMQTWKPECAKLVAAHQFATEDACYLAKSDQIDGDVAKTTTAIQGINKQIETIQAKHTTSSGLFGKSIDSDAVRKDLADSAREKYKGDSIDVSQLRTKWIGDDGKERKTVPIEEVLSQDNVKNGVVTTEDVKSIMLYEETKNNGGITNEYKTSSTNGILNTADRINSARALQQDIANADSYRKQNLPTPMYVEQVGNQGTRGANVQQISKDDRSKFIFNDEKIEHIATTKVFATNVDPKNPSKGGFDDGVYVLGLTGGQGGTYSISQISHQKSDGSYEILDDEKRRTFGATYGVGNIQALDSVGYNNEIAPADRKVRYYETAPYKGLPAVVPFDVRNGWYAATRQTLPVFGAQGSYDASGKVNSFWLCNVGKNTRIEFDTGFGDDMCQQINLNTGQPIGVFPGLDSAKATALVNKAVQAIQDAANQYGNKRVKINGETMETGLPTTGKPGTKCQDFMSPKDCLLLFNVCDPVICPPSRCDLGGTFPVANVPQTGIVGSVMLCLPNIREGVAIPVCLTGIQSGIDTFVSIMKNYRDCLQENVATGKMVGICDEIYSVYMCDFFWNQVAPFADVLLPKVIEMAYGQGVRGGAEYLGVQAAWQNMQNSMNYFSQTYAINSLQAFQTRSDGKFAGVTPGNAVIAELGGQFCKSFSSIKAPAAFKSLIQPDSPPQVYAWFDTTTYTTATVPATATYKVFYHIFAGKDSGGYFNVYLKTPPSSSFYSSAPTVPVASGYIQQGGYASETKDFTAPEGYKELCVRVNTQEFCGFGKVTTDFALNYLADQYAKDAMQSKVTSSTACVGGSSSGATLLNPNLQSGVQNTISPQIYNKGIVRICATANPGQGTDVTRFVDEGYCDDQKIRCWLDKNSINTAITANDLLTKNQTLSELNSASLQGLIDSGQVIRPEDAESKLLKLQDDVSAFNGDSGKANGILQSLDELESKLIYNYHKAWRLLLRGTVNDKTARVLIGNSDAKDIKNRNGNSGTPTANGNVYAFDGNFDSGKDIYLNLNNQQTLYVINDENTKDDRIFLYRVNPSSGLKESVGVVWRATGIIAISSDGKTILSSSEIVKLDGAKVDGLPSVTSSSATSGETCTVQTVKEENSALFADGKKTQITVDPQGSAFYLAGKKIADVVNGYVNSMQSASSRPSFEEQIAEELNGKSIEDLSRGIDITICESKSVVPTDELPRQSWTLETAIAEAQSKNLNSKYSANKDFIDQLHSDGLLTDKEYNEIKGGSIFNWEENINYVLNILNRELEASRSATANDYSTSTPKSYFTPNTYIIYKDGTLNQIYVSNNNIYLGTSSVNLLNTKIGTIEKNIVMITVDIKTIDDSVLRLHLRNLNGRTYPSLTFAQPEEKNTQLLKSYSLKLENLDDREVEMIYLGTDVIGYITKGSSKIIYVYNADTKTARQVGTVGFDSITIVDKPYTDALNGGGFDANKMAALKFLHMKLHSELAVGTIQCDSTVPNCAE